MRQRGTRLSFLGGKKKEPDLPTEVEEPAGDAETASSHSPSLSRTQSRDNHRRSFFRTQSLDENAPESPGGFGSRGSFEQIGGSGDNNAADNRSAGLVGKKNSVRKRFSMLKLGRKGSKGNDMMGSLDEE